MKNIFILLLILLSLISYGKTIYSVNKDKCISCNLCVKYCPVNAIKMVNGKAIIDSSKCIGCDICVTGNGKDFNGCPTKAIERLKEAKFKNVYGVNNNKCIGCVLCVKHCPVNAIKMVNAKAVIDSSKCIGCDICVTGNGKDFNGCPTKAIKKKSIQIKRNLPK